MSVGGRVVWEAAGEADASAACDLIRRIEDRLADLSGVAAMSSTISEDRARMIVDLEAGADPEGTCAAIRDIAPAGRAVFQAPTGFGDGPDLSAHLLDLIRSGAKTATCGALRNYEAEGAPLPQPGAQMLALDWEGEPALVYEVTEVKILPFDQVPEDFALAEGEGSFAEWRAAHEAFFARTGGFDPQMPVVCERFHLIRSLA